MYIVNSTFIVPEEKAEEVIGIYQNRSKLVDQADGFLSFQLLQNQKRTGELVVHMEWASKDQYLNWVRSEQFKQIHELERKYPDQELASIIPKVNQYKVVAE
ncbi:antibiotic biosynthesis monooxygenase family protein [Sporosarcina cyprini]|uniref:antibiotic biosynthesis monooxygenase family protein n=1 Tax=Sporosarcina cyprini TaxID=2910523 RepID=UPI001EDD08E9|nr:antibiotic biosynthesis monooxygenase [Sporosarcina cyprini]MCG3086444.1 antibiotic biosynthesis monooxygenase [Sporosarcina cyprini]